MKKYVLPLLWTALTVLTACSIPQATVMNNVVKKKLPERVETSAHTDADTQQTDSIRQLVPWRTFFQDATLTALIDTALNNNRDLLLAIQQMAEAKANVLYRNGVLLPSVQATVGLGIDKTARYTAEGAGNASTDMKPGKPVPDPIADYGAGLQLNWEADLFHRLGTLKQAALEQYLATEQGKNAVKTALVAQVATAYYNLVTIDNTADVLHRYTDVVNRSLQTARIQQAAGVETALSVTKFEAELSKAKAAEYTLQQQRTEAENNINLLLGRFPQPVIRSKARLSEAFRNLVQGSVPTRFLLNRPDVQQAEHALKAAQLNVVAARKAFLPSIAVSAHVGLEAFNPAYLTHLPQSLAAGVVGSMAAPLINRKAIEADFQTADAQQVEALYTYEKTLLTAFVETANLLAQQQNADKYCQLMNDAHNSLQQATNIAEMLFRQSKAGYLDVLTAQRDELSAAMDLVDARYRLCVTAINLYRSLGGGL